MLAGSMAFAAISGVVQLATLGALTRTVRFRLLLLALAVGVYAAGPVALAIEFLLTRTMALLPGLSVSEAVRLASYTVDPFVEEFVKVVPLLALARWSVVRRQWGLTDWTLIGAGVGAGFGLLEALMRFGHRAGRAVSTPDGWVLPLGFAPPTIPSPWRAVGSWLPAPVNADLLSFSVEVGPNQHLVWSAVAGFGVGMLVRLSSPRRWIGLILVVLVGADHAANNYRLGSIDALPGYLATLPFKFAEPLAGLWPFLALVAAIAMDGARLRHSRSTGPDLLLLDEAPTPLGGAAAISRYSMLRPPWTALVAWRFALRRRAVLLGAPDPAAEEVQRLRDLLERARRLDSWGGARVQVRPIIARSLASVPRRPGPLLRRGWPVLAWLVLLVPAALYYGLGTTPWTAAIQGLLASRWVFPLVVVCLVGALGLLARQALLTGRALPDATRGSFAEVPVAIGARFAAASGAASLAAFMLIRLATGTGARDPVLRNAHVLDALSDLLLIAGIALVISAFLFFPPAGLALTTAGTYVLVPTALAAEFAGTLGLGVAGVLLSQALDDTGDAGRGSSGGSGRAAGDPVADMPQTAPRPRPAVRNWRLRNIVDNLWRGNESPMRVGNGTTMDALRNEIRTGRPTGGRFHETKVRQSVEALENWQSRFGSGATRADRLTANDLLAELRQILGSLP